MYIQMQRMMWILRYSLRSRIQDITPTHNSGGTDTTGVSYEVWNEDVIIRTSNRTCRPTDAGVLDGGGVLAGG